MSNFFQRLKISILFMAFTESFCFAQTPTVVPNAPHTQVKIIEDSSSFKTTEGFYTGDMVMGKAEAPIILVEYADLTCHHCADFQKNVFPKLKEAYIDKGLVQYVFREFPLNRAGFLGAKLARCGGKEKQPAFITLLFDQSDTWTTGRSIDDIKKNLAGYASLGGVTPDMFEKCLASKELDDTILNRRIAAEKEYNIESTPTLVLNGAILEGDHSFDVLSKAINASLKNHQKP